MDMLRSFIIYLSKAAWAQNLVTNWGFAWRTASRFIAGTKLDQAMKGWKKMTGEALKGLGVIMNPPDLKKSKLKS